MRGRVVDGDMLASIQSGCLRSESKQSYYTLCRRFEVKKSILQNTAQMIVASPGGQMNLCPAGRVEISNMYTLGSRAVQNQMLYHNTISKAICGLHEASNLPRPSLEEELLQVSIGGNTASIHIGQFLPCQMLCDQPNIKVRCACGFVVNDEHKPMAKPLLRRRCTQGKSYISSYRYQIMLILKPFFLAVALVLFVRY